MVLSSGVARSVFIEAMRGLKVLVSSVFGEARI